MKPYLLFFIVVASVITCTGGEVLQAADECSLAWGLLDIKPVQQEEDIWCWVASTTEVLNRLGVPHQVGHPPYRPYSQCVLFNIVKSPVGIDCCSVAHPTGVGECKKTGWPDDVFDKLKIPYTPGGALPWNWVKGQICPQKIHPGVYSPGEPFIYAAEPERGGIPHTYTAKGFNENGPNGQQVLYVDSHVSLGSTPLGASIVDYDCYYKGICPNTIYTHAGDYYNIHRPAP
jgi:hypothetical protein